MMPAAAPPPALAFTVTPAAPGRQLVRVSLPLEAREAVLQAEPQVRVSDGKTAVVAGSRVLTRTQTLRHGAVPRRLLVTFPYSFRSRAPVVFRCEVPRLVPAPAPTPARKVAAKLPVSIDLRGESVGIRYRSGPALTATLAAPARGATSPPTVETVEENAHYLWKRYTFSDPHWTRILEVRADALGGVVVVGHLQQVGGTDGWAPEFGWDIRPGDPSATLTAGGEAVSTHAFRDETPCTLSLAGGKYTLYHPAAPFKRKGKAALSDGVYAYRACLPGEKVPMQPYSWRRAEFVVAPAGLAGLRPSLTSPHALRDSRALAETPLPDDLRALVAYHREAIVKSLCHGDDWGNVTSFGDTSPTGGAFGMNRLNHALPLFAEGYRSGDRRLVETALLWCDNFHDQSIWWGEPERGGTRYNNVTAMGGKPPEGDTGGYMWRSNSSVSFCTKGYDAFYAAYEETGDPRMIEALDAQADYAAKHLHAGINYTRNIGDVRDFLNLWEWTGERRYRDEASRLFATLKPCLSTGDLFTESGQPIVADPPFIDDDQVGPKYPYAKPYIIGYGLAGLPQLSGADPKVQDVVRAVADFMADSQDPVGGWRYPHPRASSVILSQAIEHAWQVSQLGDRLSEKHLDAIERVLRQRIWGWKKTGRILSGLEGWEMATGKIKARAELYSLYKKPGDRDFSRDWSEGTPTFGWAPPEGLVYFEEVLRRYLARRPVARLLAEPPADSPLGKVLARVRKAGP